MVTMLYKYVDGLLVVVLEKEERVFVGRFVFFYFVFGVYE